MKYFILSLMLPMLVLTSVLVSADDKALLIGVGKYQNPEANLPGIDLDIDIMRKVADIMGYEQDNIKVLMDDQATLSNVETTIEHWLVNDTDKDDRIFIYFSGHGTRIPDENGDESQDDGEDEVLVMHDFKPVQLNGKDSLINVLVDDRINYWLTRIPSQSTILIVDACNSGTVTKNVVFNTRGLGEKSGVSKFYHYKGMPNKDVSASGVFNENTSLGSNKGLPGRYIGLSAAQDTQFAIATDSGSVFSLGILEVLQRARSMSKPITSHQLIARVKRYIAAKVEPSKVFYPNLTGNDSLANQALFSIPDNQNTGLIWQQITDIAEKNPGLLLTADAALYQEGDPISLSVKIPPGGGYLNVVSVDRHDNATILFPNKFHPQNKMASGLFSFPSDDMKFDLPAQAPFGKTLFVAVVTQQPLNLFEMGFAKRSDTGEILNAFARLSPKAMKNIRVVANTAVIENNKIIAGRIVVTVNP
jgi:metacaspase-1